MGSEAYLEAHSQKHGLLDDGDSDDEDEDESEALLFQAAAHMTLKKDTESSEDEVAVG